jgi:hypothetical protein
MMSNSLIKLAVITVNGLGTRQARNYSIERGLFDPGNPDHLQEYGFHLLGNALKTPSRGLHKIPSSSLQEFSLFLANRATDAALYVDNSRSNSLFRQGHVYEYRSPRISISTEAVVFIKDKPENSMRLLLRAFTRDALELPPGTVANMRERMNSGTRDGVLFSELREDSAVKSFQRSQWDRQAPVVGDVMLGHNSIIVNTRHERYVLNNERYIVDIINPATREFHILDGSSLWFRIVDTIDHTLVFAAIGSGKHRHALMDAFNNWGAMSIWHCMALVQQHLYDAVPSTYDEITAHISRARLKCGPVAQKLYQTLTRGDTDRTGAFLRRLRVRQAFENGDGYLSS